MNMQPGWAYNKQFKVATALLKNCCYSVIRMDHMAISVKTQY